MVPPSPTIPAPSLPCENRHRAKLLYHHAQRELRHQKGIKAREETAIQKETSLKAILEHRKQADADAQKLIEFKNSKCVKTPLDFTKATIEMFMKLTSKKLRSFIHIHLWKEVSPLRNEAKKFPHRKKVLMNQMQGLGNQYMLHTICDPHLFLPRHPRLDDNVNILITPNQTKGETPAESKWNPVLPTFDSNLITEETMPIKYLLDEHFVNQINATLSDTQ